LGVIIHTFLILICMRNFTRVGCFIIGCLLGPRLAPAQSWQSAVALPGSSRVSALVADGAGGYVVTGDFSATLTLGSFVLTSSSNDIFVARLSTAGTWTQAVAAGGAGSRTVRALALDLNGGVVVAGSFSSATATIGAATLTNLSTSGTEDIFVARLSAAGQWTQAVRAGGPGIDAVNGLVVNPTNGTATVAGSFVGGSSTFGPRTLTGASSNALYVARLNSAGTWTQAVGVVSSGAPNAASGVALDAAGNAVVSGYRFGGGSVQFGSITLNSSSTVAFVARLNAAGTWTQAVQATTAGGFIGGGPVAVDANDNVVLAGNFRNGPATFGPYTLTYTPDFDNMYVARLSSAGVWTQAAQVVDCGRSFPNSLSLAADGSVWVAGQFGSPLARFGPTTLTNPSTAPTPPSTALTVDVFVARLSAAGTWTYAAQAGGLQDDYPTAVLLDGSRVLVAGAFGPAPASFGALTLTTPASATGFIAGLGGGLLPTASGSAASLTLAPNPATATTRLTLSADPAPRLVVLLDALGREVRRQPVPAQATAAEVNLTGLVAGLYVVRCGLATRRLVVE
jgi:hypothetical protein